MNVYRMKDSASMPAYATEGSAAFDLTACVEHGQRITAYNSWNKQVQIAVKGVGGVQNAFQLPPGMRVLVPTGLIFDIPEGHVMKMYIRSGTALKKGLTLTNGVGIIDSDYTDEVFMMLSNITDSLAIVEHGDRLVQCTIEKSLRSQSKLKLTESNEKPEKKLDRDGGFGSTG